MAGGLDLGMVAGKSALMTTQNQISIVSNNVARANDPYYHRQTSSVDPNITVLGDSGYYGTGVHIAQIVRQYDVALESSLRGAKCDTGYSQAYYNQIGRMEDILAPGGDDQLNSTIQAFANNAQAVASNPEELANRVALITSAETLADKFNQNYENLSQLRNYIADNNATGTGAITTGLNDVKGLLQQIPELNKKIMALESNAFRNQKANDLRDERDKIVSQISEYIDISVREESDTRYTITCDGNTLINGTYSPQLGADYLEVSMTNTPPSPHYVPSIVLHSDNTTTVNLTDGKIKGYQDAHTYISGKMDKLYSYAQNYGDSLAYPADNWEGATAYVAGNTIRPVPANGYVYSIEAGDAGTTAAGQPVWPTTVGGTVADGTATWTCLGKFSTVNSAHMSGYDLNGDPGAKLFSTSATQPASGNILTVSISDPKKVAASSIGDETAADPSTAVQKGNGENMLAMWSEMSDDSAPNPALDGESILNYANRYLSDVSTDVAIAKNNFNSSENIQNMFQNAVNEVSGVSMDAEMTEMLELQRSYQAAAKLINTIDQMMSMVLGMF